MTEKEISDVAASIRGLCLTTNTAEVEQFIAGWSFIRLAIHFLSKSIYQTMVKSAPKTRHCSLINSHTPLIACLADYLE